MSWIEGKRGGEIERERSCSSDYISWIGIKMSDHARVTVFLGQRERPSDHTRVAAFLDWRERVTAFLGKRDRASDHAIL